MKDLNTGSSTLMRQINESIVLDSIRHHGSISRSAIAEITGMMPSTISSIVDGLVEKGLVVMKGKGESSGGRRPVLLEVNPESGFVVGVDAGLVELVAVIVDLRSQELARVRKDNWWGEDGTASAHIIMDTVRELIAEAGLEQERLRGIGVGIGGLVDRQSDLAFPAALGGEGIPFRSMIEAEFGIPTFVDNNANVGALAVKWLGKGANVADLLYVTTYLGCGIIINNQLCYGASGSAGQLGFGNQNVPCGSSGDHCYLEAGEMSLSTLAKDAVEEGAHSEISSMVQGRVSDITPEVVVEAARHGDEVALEIIEAVARDMGVKIAFLVNCLNPELV